MTWPMPDPLLSEVDVLRVSAWLFVVDELLVLATESVSDPEVVQASDWVTDWLWEAVFDWLWVVPSETVSDWLEVWACMEESAEPLLAVTPSDEPQLALPPTLADKPTPAGAMLPPTLPFIPYPELSVWETAVPKESVCEDPSVTAEPSVWAVP
jgi:hypothetical protein